MPRNITGMQHGAEIIRIQTKLARWRAMFDLGQNIL